MLAVVFERRGSMGNKLEVRVELFLFMMGALVGGNMINYNLLSLSVRLLNKENGNEACWN